MLAGYPLWWLLGAAEIVPFVAAAVMAIQLLKMRKITVQPGFGWWLIFLAWVGVGVFLLQVDAPNAVPDHSVARYATFGFRLGWYLVATITLLYVYNMRGRLPTDRILRAFSWLFVTVVIGGVLGTIAPGVDFPSVIELALPHRIRHIQYVHDIVHPVIAQRYAVAGILHPRASAPFAYTNDWGLNFACLLPFFLLGWLGRDAGWRRKAGPIILLVSVYPVVMTQNRGMWIALLVIGALIAVRAGLFGHAKPLFALFALTAAMAVILVATPLGHTITNRFANGYSNSGRASLGRLTVDSVVRKSPVVGLGSTRNVQGSFYSIAGGDTADCSICTPPALGTQGHFWLLIFSTGVAGLLLYLGFMIQQFLRGLGRNTPIATLAVAVLLTHLTTMFVYDTIGVALVTIFAAIGLLWRDKVEGRAPAAGSGSPAPGNSDRRLGAYPSMLRANAALMIVCVGLGATLGFVLGHSRDRQYAAEATMAVPPARSYPGVATFAPTLDTVADLVEAAPVRTAIVAAARHRVATGRVSVTATPNSQVLHMQYLDVDPSRAGRIAMAAAHAVDQQRMALVNQARAQALATLKFQQQALAKAVIAIDDLPKLTPGGVLADTRGELQTQLVTSAMTVGQIQADPVTPSTITQNASVLVASGRNLVAVCTGLVIGLLFAVVIAFLRDAISPRVGRRGTIRTIAGMWILHRVRPGVDWDELRSDELTRIHDLLGALGSSFVVAGDDDEATKAAASSLNRMIREANSGERIRPDRAVVLAGPRARHRHLRQVRTELERRGVSVCGLILNNQRLDTGGYGAEDQGRTKAAAIQGN